MGRHDGVPSAGRERDLADRLDLGGSVRRERVDRHDDRHPEDPDVLDLLRKVRRARPDGLDVLLEQRGIERLAGHDPADAPMHLERPHGRDDDGRVGREAGRPALDVEELLGAHVRAEARLGTHDLVRRERKPVGDDRVVAMGDVRERAAMDEGGTALEGLEQVRLDRVGQQGRHRARDAQILGGDRRAILASGHHHPAQTCAEVMDVMGQGQDRHHLGSDRDDEFGLARDAVLLAAEPDDHPSNGAIADVHDARPEDRERIDPEGVAVMEVVVDERGPEVVGGTDRMDVAGQVKVEVSHRDDLAVAAARRSALDPEHGAEGGLADADRRLPTDAVESLGEPDGRRRLAFA